MTETKKETSKQTELLDKLVNKQKTEEVTWKDNEGKKHTTKLVLKEPTSYVSMQLADLTNGEGSIAQMDEIFEILMDKVIVSPRMGFKELNDEVPEKLREKIVKYKNADGDDFKVVYKFPGYRAALRIMNEVQRNNGAMNMTSTISDILEECARDVDGKKLTWDDVDDADKLDGNAMAIFNDGFAMISEVVSSKGTMDILMSAFQMAISKLNRVN